MLAGGNWRSELQRLLFSECFVYSLTAELLQATILFWCHSIATLNFLSKFYDFGHLEQYSRVQKQMCL